MKFARKFRDTMPERTLKYRLHQHLTLPNDARPVSTIHASDLTDPNGFCPRMFALADATKFQPPGRALSTSLHVTFEIGRLLQDRIVHWFSDLGLAVGHWKCHSCGKLETFCKRPKACPTCGCASFKPIEVRFVSAVSGASCGVDMLASLNGPLLTAVEIKTIDKEEFKALEAPLSEHRRRTALYLRLIAESEHPFAKKVSSDHARVLYVSKGGYGCLDKDVQSWGQGERFSPFKEFKIRRDDDLTEEATKRARVVRDFRNGEIGMPEGICDTAMSKRAKACPLRSACFSGDYPVSHWWREE